MMPMRSAMLNASSWSCVTMHRRDADGPLNLANRAPQLFANLGVERTERLVEQQYTRLVRESPSQARHAAVARPKARSAGARRTLRAQRASAARCGGGAARRGALAAHAARTRCCRLRSCAGTARSSGRRSRPRVAFAPRLVTSRPCRTMRPWSIVVRPAMARSSVLLPLPEGPRSTKSSPSSIRR